MDYGFKDVLVGQDLEVNDELVLEGRERVREEMSKVFGNKFQGRFLRGRVKGIFFIQLFWSSCLGSSF